MQATITRLGLFIFCLGTSFYFYDFVLQVAPGVMAIPLMESFRISAGVLGTLSGVYFYSYTLMQIPAGLLLDRFGAQTVLPWVVLACAAGAIIFGAANHIYFLGLGRFLMGAGSAFAFLGSLYLATRWLPLRTFALFAGIVQMVGSLGGVGGQAVAYLIHGMGWRASMILFGVIGLVLAIILRCYLHETVDHRSFAKMYTKGRVWSNLMEVVRHPQTWWIGIYSFAIWAPIASFGGLWGVPFLTLSYHMSNIKAAAFISLIWLVMALASPPIGWFSDIIKRRVWLLWACALIGVISSVFLVYWPHNNDYVIGFELSGIGFAAAGDSLIFAVIQDIQPLQLNGAANGFNNMMIVFSGAILQPAIGWLMDFYHAGGSVGASRYTLMSFQHALWIFPLCYLIAIIAAYFFIKETFCKQQVVSRNSVC